jgi:hypothetical protein
MRVPSDEEATHRETLLQRFRDMGFHLRLLSHLRGKTADEQWHSLERLVLDPETPPDEVLRGNWGPYYDLQTDEDPPQGA